MEKVVFEYKDLGLASYILLNGGNYCGKRLSFNKKFKEYKLYIKIVGNKEELIRLKNYYDNNKITINKKSDVINKINELKYIIEKQ